MKPIQLPLAGILNWWESLEDFPKGIIAAYVLVRLTTHAHVMERHDALFRDFLTERRLDAARYIGRVIAIRSVIDYEFDTTDLNRHLHSHLENVEGDNQDLKRLSNNAIPRLMQVDPGWKKARAAWRKLKKTAISNDTLKSFETACMVHGTVRRLQQ
jgi:hypothetical protein